MISENPQIYIKKKYASKLRRHLELQTDITEEKLSTEYYNQDVKNAK